MSAITYVIGKTAAIGENLKAGQVAIAVPRIDGGKGKSGEAIAVTAISDASLQSLILNEAGREWIVSQLDRFRSGMVKAAYKGGGNVTVDLGLDAMIAAMQAANESERLTQKAIIEWFSGAPAAAITTVLKEKGASQDKIDTTLTTVGKIMAKIAGRTALSKEECNTADKVLGVYSPEDDPMAARIAEAYEELQQSSANALDMLEAI